MSSSNPYPENERPIEAWCDPTHLHVRLADGRELVTPLWWYPRLLAASPSERNRVELMLDGVHWPDVDEDLSVRGMLRGWKYPDAIPPSVAAEQAMRHNGSCRCGLISAETDAEPILRSYCHCRDCRKQTGAPVMAFVAFREDDLAWHGTPKTWRAGGVVRSFCDHCGSQIGYRDVKLPGEVYLSLGFMDEPELYPPSLHAFDKRRLPFLHIADDLPRYDGFSIER